MGGGSSKESVANRDSNHRRVLVLSMDYDLSKVIAMRLKNHESCVPSRMTERGKFCELTFGLNHQYVSFYFLSDDMDVREFCQKTKRLYEKLISNSIR
jgi:hypothetical protein